MSTKTAKDIMTKRVITVKPSTSIAEAARLMVRRKVSGVPVVDEKDKTKVVGILTEADILAAPAGAKTVAEVMRKRVVSVTPDTSVDDIAAILVKCKIKRVPVIDNGKLVGIVSRIDVLRAKTAAEAQSDDDAWFAELRKIQRRAEKALGLHTLEDIMTWLRGRPWRVDE